MSTYIQATKEIAIKQFSTIKSYVKQHPFLTAIPLLILTLGALYRFSHQTTKDSSNSNDGGKPAASGSGNPAPLTRPRQGETINAQNNSNTKPLFGTSETKQTEEPGEAPSESVSDEEQQPREQIPLARQDETIDAQNNSNNESLFGASETKESEKPEDDGCAFTFEAPEEKQTEEPEDAPFRQVAEEKQVSADQAPLAGQDGTVDAQDKSQILVLNLALQNEQSNPTAAIKDQVQKLNAGSILELYNMCQDAQRQKLIGTYLSAEQLAHLVDQLDAHLVNQLDAEQLSHLVNQLNAGSILEFYNKCLGSQRNKLIGIHLSPKQLAHLATQLHNKLHFYHPFRQVLISTGKDDRLTDFFQEFSKSELLTIKEKHAFFEEVCPSYNANTKDLYKNLELILISSALIQHDESQVAKLYPARAMTALKTLNPESIKIDLTSEQHKAFAKVNLPTQITNRYQQFKNAPEVAKPQAAQGVIRLLTTRDLIKATFNKYEDLRPYFVRFLSEQNLTELLNNPECLQQAQKAISINGFAVLRKKDARLLQN